MKNISIIYSKKSGISLIALIITIIVIIILSAIVIGVAFTTPEQAGTARFVADISEVQQAVSIKRAENYKPTPDGSFQDLNTGFTKIKLKKTSTGEFEDGWVVNLNTINLKNSSLRERLFKCIYRR
jgi:type II secretory pathway pseudopilin PulG